MTTPEPKWVAVDEYLAQTIVREDEALIAAVRDSAAAGLPPIHVSPPLGKTLMLLAQLVGARRILEIGTLGGYSTIWLARAPPASGRIVTLELQARHVAVARSNLARGGVADRVDVLEGSALESLSKLASAGGPPFDMVFIDADKVGYVEYLRWSLRLTRPGAVIVADNVVRGGAVADANDADANVRAVRDLHEAVAREPRLSAVTLQTVGSKGYDGFMLLRVD